VVANAIELEGRAKGGGVRGMTHVFETFLSEYCEEESVDVCVVRHYLSFAETRQSEGVISRF